ncbi:two-component hybrid sensor and regulator [Anaerovibrio sp. JC8]|uniref:response regulator n=1 Tax=Anaerovibrio sp. JC8 TaxID=1240085 RepID=UPI000A0A4035|nr:response regulator [Anaerovibrio sp. JC8]ORT99987.1 two-component hybrid sensor and regulator [Anaerovibrio sp. JC8]
MGDQSKKRILIIDDAEVNQLLLSRILEAYELLNAYTGEQAFEQLRANGETLDLIILDLVLPDMNGLELLKFMKADDTLKEIPVVVMSAQVQMEQTSLDMGAVEFWKKPFWNAQEVQNRVAKYFE